MLQHKKLIFKAHKTGLNKTNHSLLLKDSAMWAAIKKSIELFLPNNFSTLRAVDLGCMEGGYSLELARLGFNTLGIDARHNHLLKASVIKLKANLPHLNFVKDDVRNLAVHGQFDLALCSGIFYHLDDPVQFLKTLYAQCNVVVLHTFYAPSQSLFYDMRSSWNTCKKKLFSKQKPQISLLPGGAPYIQHIKSYRLSPLTQHEGYTGRWYHEWDAQKSREEIENMPGAAYNNPRSFWLCKTDLIKALYQVGFTSVYEQHDDIQDLGSRHPKKFYNRVLLVAKR